VENITGYGRQEVLGKNPSLWGGQMAKDFYVKMWHTLSVEKKSFAGEIRNKRKNGESYEARSSISPILDDNGNIIYYVGVERDITKEKEIDRSKSEFVSLASHQLRTPLSAINWYSEMLLGGDAGALTDKQKDYTQEIYGSSKRMSNLVGALLNVSRIELGTFAVELKPTKITEIADSCIQEMGSKVKQKNQLIEKQYAPDIPVINVDQNLMRIVFQNLISNSVKYTPDGGKIIVSVQKNDKDLEVKVQDNGYGIPAQQQNKIFRKFFRADNIIPVETDGTGLGLYIVKEVVEKAGGSVRFESEENKGTTFYINLPLGGMQAKEGTRSLN
jgi:PAS domain S-box-containing protein